MSCRKSLAPPVHVMLKAEAVFAVGGNVDETGEAEAEGTGFNLKTAVERLEGSKVERISCNNLDKLECPQRLLGSPSKNERIIRQVRNIAASAREIWLFPRQRLRLRSLGGDHDKDAPMSAARPPTSPSCPVAIA